MGGLGNPKRQCLFPLFNDFVWFLQWDCPSFNNVVQIRIHLLISQLAWYILIDECNNLFIRIIKLCLLGACVELHLTPIWESWIWESWKSLLVDYLPQVKVVFKWRQFLTAPCITCCCPFRSETILAKVLNFAQGHSALVICPVWGQVQACLRLQ